MRHRSFGTTMRMVARATARAERAKHQAQARAASTYARAIKNASRQEKADAKEAARLYVASRSEEAEELNQTIRDRESAISNLLSRALSLDPKVDLGAMYKTFVPKIFDETRWRSVAPSWFEYEPEPLSFFGKLIPGAVARQAKRVETEKRLFDRADAEHRERMDLRNNAFLEFDKEETLRKAEVEKNNAAVSECQRGLMAGEHQAMVTYFMLAVSSSLHGEPDAFSAEVGYSTDAYHLVVDLELPEFSAVPEESGFRYVKAGDRIDAIARPIAKRKALYSNLISQTTLKCIDTAYRSSPKGAVECLTLNGMLDAVDPATGQQVRACLVSVRITADTFASLDLTRVNPEQCLRSLKALVSRSPDELLAVR